MFNFLFVSTKWFSDDGGIQTINRELCKQVALIDNKVYVLLIDGVRDEEKKDAEQFGIELIQREDIKQKIQDINLDFVCTHASFTGGWMDTIKEYCKDTVYTPQYIHFIHHDPEEIEILKSSDGSGQMETRNEKKQKEIEFASKADGVICIGKSLKDAYKREIVASNSELRQKIKHINCGVGEDDLV
jgi:hypothetical protein